MPIADVKLYELTDSTLGELREIVEATAGMPGDAVVRVKGRMEIDVKRGPRIQSVRIAAGELS